VFVGASTDTVTFWEPPAATLFPDAGLTWHQLVEDAMVAVQEVRVAVPVFSIAMVLPAGVAPPETPEKEKLAGARTMWAVGAGFTWREAPPKAQFVAPVGV